ncbi:hypothetical protein EDB85DRAFT_1818041, partial [Lactarius pseudohatsudake]
VLSIDCEVIVATGAGKTLPFVLPLLARPDMIVVILSPLDALKLDQEYRFKKIDLHAKAINWKTYNNTMRKYPEFWKSLADASISKRIAAFIIDVAHCITHWGDKFQDAYASIGTLHTFIPASVM